MGVKNDLMAGPSMIEDAILVERKLYILCGGAAASSSCVAVGWRQVCGFKLSLNIGNKDIREWSFLSLESLKDGFAILR
jgi:hypothetical protein